MPTVIFCVYNNFKLAHQSLSRVLIHTPSEFEILVIDDCSAEGFFNDHVDPTWINRITLIRNEENIGLTRSLNIGLKMRRHHNGTFFVNSDVLVGPSWAENLLLEANSSDLVGTVTAATNNGTITTVRGLDLKDIDDELSIINEFLDSLPPIPPIQIPVPVGHCFFATEIAINLSGGFDEFFSPGYGEEVDFGLRLNLVGLHHLVSTKVFVYHYGSASFGSLNPKKIENDKEIELRYPNHAYEISKHLDRFREFETIESRVRASLGQLTLLIDVRTLIGGRTGTFEVINGILSKSSQSKFSRICLLVNDAVKTSDIYTNYECMSESEIQSYLAKSPRFDVVFSPSQVGSVAGLIQLFSFATKVVVMQLDYIAADNSAYFITSDKFSDYRDAASITLSLADAIFFNSRQVQRESHRFGTRYGAINDIESIGNGIEKFRESEGEGSLAVQRLNQILVIGTSFSHKNRPYALEIFAHLHQRFPDYHLVLIGPEPDFGSSLLHEKRQMDTSEFLKSRVKVINWLPDDDLARLIRSSKLILLTSVSEGFGLVPGEAALAGTPSIFPNRHSFLEVYPDTPFFICLENLSDDVQRITELLESEENLEKQHNYLLNVAHSYQWGSVTDRIFRSLYDVAISPSYGSYIEVIKIRDSLKPVSHRRLRDHWLMRKIFPIGSYRRQLAARIFRVIHSKRESRNRAI